MARGSSANFDRALRELREQQLIAADAREVIHVARLGHADAGIDEKIRFHLLRSAEGEFHVGAVHRIAGLEGDYFAPSQAGELSAQLRRRQAQSAEIIVRRQLQAFDAAPHVPRVPDVHRIVRARMSLAGGAKYCLGFGGAVGLPDFFHVQNGEHHAFAVAQRDFAAAGA